MENTILKREVRVCTINGTTRVYLTLELRKHARADHKRTVDLEKCPLEYHELSICGSVKCTGSWEGGGQCQDTIRELIRDAKRIEYEGEATHSTLLEILDVWDRWHLNDMHAGTREQELAIKEWQAAGNKYDFTEAQVMLVRKNLHPHRGYSYGSAWLLEPLPPETEVRIVALFDLFCSH